MNSIILCRHCEVLHSKDTTCSIGKAEQLKAYYLERGFRLESGKDFASMGMGSWTPPMADRKINQLPKDAKHHLPVTKVSLHKTLNTIAETDKLSSSKMVKRAKLIL